MATALLFSGQGAQAVGMGKSLSANEPEVKLLYEQANDLLGFDLAGMSFQGPEDELMATKICQPALFVHGYAVFTILRKRGKLEGLTAALGLSLGELTALTVAGAMDFEVGLKTVAERARLMQAACEQTDGGMASVIGGTREQVAELCELCDIQMANLNCPGQIVISGEKAKVSDAVAKGEEMGFKLIKPLNVAGAYHSRLMESARQAFAEYLKGVDIRTPEITVFTNTTGQVVSDPQDIRHALSRQVVSSVLWEDCMINAEALPIDTWYECGPGRVLAGLARRINGDVKVQSIAEYEDFPPGK